MRARWLYLVFLVVLMTAALAACGEPEVITETETVEQTVEVPVEQTVVVQETVEVEREVEVPGETITFWSTEHQPDRAAATQEIIDRFREKSGINVELVLVDENNLRSMITAAVAAGTLPDVVFFPVDYAIGWAEQGILDTETATSLVDELGQDTFAQGALDLVAQDGTYAAIPSDGWGQLLIYRQDLFEENGLAPPDNFAAIRTAAETLNDPDNNFYGITMANDPSAVFTQQTFEQFALANGCQLVNEGGEIPLDSPECVEAINFYTELMSNYSAQGVQDVVSTRATYFAGQAAMIVWSPFILDEMAGLRDDAFPACPECEDSPEYLATNSGIVPAFIGPSGSEPAQYGQVSYIGITATANKEASQEFIRFWFNEGYIDWLGVAAEGKLPMRRGTAEEPTRFIDGWKELEVGVDRTARLGDIYGDEVTETLIDGAQSFKRWGFTQGQGALVTAVYEDLTVPNALNDVLDGVLTAEEAGTEMSARVEQIMAEIEME